MAARAGVVHMARLNQSTTKDKPLPSQARRTFSTEEQAARSQAQSKIDREAREEVLQAHYGHRAFYCLPFEHPIRQFAIRTVESRWFRMAVLFVIFLNSVCMRIDG
eukprot:TRINITY_DN1051_c0_g1_i2.p1 TRINITY_DN1051_c0_g1~~TRINITY_DN1051_c0_g1_i2.p1  ORF type:complete len:106 (-),score=6.69 TRINITY_DN1051_c0_g1_i2:116-433(-)